MKHSALVTTLVLAGVWPLQLVAAFETSSADDASTLRGRAVPDYRAIVEAGGPAVVGILVAGLHRARAGHGDEQVAAQGLPHHLPPGRSALRQRSPTPSGAPFRGQGSGFIVSADGLVLTNAHVVYEAGEVVVRLRDRREFVATVLGADPLTDVAVLRINAQGLPVVRIGDPNRLRVGDAVLAIGAPFGFEQSATAGIVSAKGRSLPGDTIVPFIQTDAAVNPGNSGGPLFDAAGEVIGINAQIYSRSGGFEGLSFAIPIDVAMTIMSRIVSTGQVIHARLGVTAQDLDQSLAEAFGLQRPHGALVASVTRNSPAERSGLRAGDVITHVDGQLLERSGSLSSSIALALPSEAVQLELWRDGSAHRIGIRLDQAPTALPSSASEAGATAPGHLGLTLRALTSHERRAFGADGGLIVEHVAGAAQRAGLQAGDLILAINGTPVHSFEQVLALTRGQPRAVALLVQRGGESLYLAVRLG